MTCFCCISLRRYRFGIGNLLWYLHLLILNHDTLECLAILKLYLLHSPPKLWPTCPEEVPEMGTIPGVYPGAGTPKGEVLGLPGYQCGAEKSFHSISKWKLIHFGYVCTPCPHCTIQLPPGNVNSQRSHSQLCKGWANTFYGQILIVIFLYVAEHR